MKIQSLTFKGERQMAPVGAPSGLQPQETYRVGAHNRDTQSVCEVDLKENDKLLQFIFDDNTSWMCDADTLHELFPEADILHPSRSYSSTLELPTTLKSPHAERGVFGEIGLKLLNVFLKDGLQGSISKLAVKLEEHHLPSGEGLFVVDKNFKLTKYKPVAESSPILLFLHGTNSSGPEAFKGLLGSDVWEDMHEMYPGRVLAYEHRTLSKSPLQNVVDMAAQLPDRAVLHIVSHSRGGLVGDILNRYSEDAQGKIKGFSKVNLELLKKEERQADIDCIILLAELFKEKQIKVEKFVRVACPSAGTVLASKRIDTILNVFFNLLGAQVNPILDTLKELLAESIKTKCSVKVLPGLESMDPDSPFIKILNDRAEDSALDGGVLAVIAGSGKFSLSLRGLFVILGKLFYWQKNDLVVNTDSMYLGAGRSSKIQYFFAQGPEVDHVKYFFNQSTRQAIAYALNTPYGQEIPGYLIKSQAEIPSTDRGIFGIEHGDLFPESTPPSGTKPIVVLLPGIMGSNIARKGDKIWLNYTHTLFGGLKDLTDMSDPTIEASSLIKTSYKKLANRLSYAYDVVVFPFDWRKPLPVSAQAFNDKIIELLKYNQPVKIIGHSMGGVLVRDFIINHDATWQRLNASKGFKMLFLGSPLGGSVRIMTVLFGVDSIINSLNKLDRVHSKKELLTMFSGMPGLLCLLPLSTDVGNDFADVQTWIDFRSVCGDDCWPIPKQSDLDAFRVYRDHVLEKRESIDYTNMIYIAGKDKATPFGCRCNKDLPELEFLATAEGDQSVTWESGIPQQLHDAKAVYYVDVSHGQLANDPKIFGGIEELLERGTTSQLSRSKPQVRGEEKVFRMPPSYVFDPSQWGIEEALFGSSVPEQEIASSQIPVTISVSNGDLAYASFPVMVGHFKNDGILYAEKAIDHKLDKILSARHDLGLYPGDIGSSDVLLNHCEEESFKGAIIVGLGEAGHLTAHLLAKTVAQGVANYLLNIKNQTAYKGHIGISTLIIGCGYGGLSQESSIKAIMEGVYEANEKVSKLHKAGSRTIQHIEFVEVYEEKAVGALYALSKLQRKEGQTLNFMVGEQGIKKLFGAKRRLLYDASEDWWHRITVKFKHSTEGPYERSSLVFGAATGDAREEERQLYSSTALIDLFVGQVSTENNWSARSAKTLFELMIPNDFKERLKRKGNITLVLDKATAAYPWELLQDHTHNAEPLCVGAGMIRQLSTANYRISIKRVANDRALVIGDPVLHGFIGQLPGAAEEAASVEKILSRHGYNFVSLIQGSAAEVISGLFSDDYKIIHLAGHGIYDPLCPHKSGMVIGDGVFLSPLDIAQMSTVPELVFVNCCHLGKSHATHETYFQDRFKLAANIGTQLIEMGVKAVIAAGWAVNDEAAKLFAETFYTCMFEGYTFGMAVKEARAQVYKVYKLSNNTWGAYQCYGDPFYKIVEVSEDPGLRTPQYIMAQEVEMDLYNLKGDLDTSSLSPETALAQLREISTAAEKAQLKNSEILELEALILYELAAYDKAIQKFEALREEEFANFSVAALEKYCVARTKKYVLDFKNSQTKIKVEDQITEVINELKDLLKIEDTAERYNLLGSAYCRKAYVTTQIASKTKTYKTAQSYYLKSYKAKVNTNALINWGILEFILGDAAAETKDTKIMKSAFAQLKDNVSLGGSQDYTHLFEETCKTLAALVTSKEEDALSWKLLESKYNSLWDYAGSKGKKVAEIEYLDILMDLAGISSSRHSSYLSRKLVELKAALEKKIGGDKL